MVWTYIVIFLQPRSTSKFSFSFYAFCRIFFWRICFFGREGRAVHSRNFPTSCCFCFPLTCDILFFTPLPNCSQLSGAHVACCLANKIRLPSLWYSPQPKTNRAQYNTLACRATRNHSSEKHKLVLVLKLNLTEQFRAELNIPSVQPN